MALIPPARTYEPRHPDYDPEKLCTATKVKIVGNTEVDFICEWPMHHDTKVHSFRFDSETRITWV